MTEQRDEAVKLKEHTHVLLAKWAGDVPPGMAPELVDIDHPPPSLLELVEIVDDAPPKTLYRRPDPWPSPPLV